MQLYLLGISRKMDFCFAKMTTGQPTVRLVKVAGKLSLAQSCLPVTTSSIPSALLVHRAVPSSAMARAMPSSKGPSSTVACATRDKCNRSTELPSIPLSGNHTASDLWRYHQIQNARRNRGKLNSRWIPC